MELAMPRLRAVSPIATVNPASPARSLIVWLVRPDVEGGAGAGEVTKIDRAMLPLPDKVSVSPAVQRRRDGIGLAAGQVVIALVARPREPPVPPPCRPSWMAPLKENPPMMSVRMSACHPG